MNWLVSGGVSLMKVLMSGKGLHLASGLAYVSLEDHRCYIRLRKYVSHMTLSIE